MAAQHFLSFSGGKDSTAMYLLALERFEKRGKTFMPVFADTEHEHEAVYEFLDYLPEKTGGPKIRRVKADFTEEIARRRAYVIENYPPERVEAALSVLKPTGNVFLDLALSQGTFPSAKVRFCTRDLKIKPMEQQVYVPIAQAHPRRGIIVWMGVRAQESLVRRGLSKFQRFRAGWGSYMAYRPLLAWTIEDVWAMHKRFGIEPNKLYQEGFDRVGCFPCIYSNKNEIAQIGQNFGETVEKLKRWEEAVNKVSLSGMATFFSYRKDTLLDIEKVKAQGVDLKKHGIENIIDWAKTSHGGRQRVLDFMLEPMTDPMLDMLTDCDIWGACEA